MDPASRIERLRQLFGDTDIWQEPIAAQHELLELEEGSSEHSGVRSGNSDAARVSDSTALDDEDVLNTENMVTYPDETGKGPKYDDKLPVQSLEDLEKEVFCDLGLEMGETAPAQTAFCPWRLLKQYADKYVGKANTPKVEGYFKEEALFRTQPWDFFYLFPPAEVDRHPLLLVPTTQLEYLLRTINKKHHIALTIPDGDSYFKFAVRFGVGGSPRPRYLGRVTDHVTLTRTKENMPYENHTELDGLSFLARDDYIELLKKIHYSFKGKSDKKAQQAYRNRYMKHKLWGKAAKRVQRYLGLRGEATDDKVQTPLSSLTMLDLSLPAPFPPEDSVVFVCFDVETYEMAHDVVTEVGFAVLDTKDIAGVPPGKGGEDWFKLIRARHLRVEEVSYLVNQKYVKGCPDAFMFGKSEFVPKRDMKKAILEILSHNTPLSAGESDETQEGRPIIVVGHDVKQDIEHVKKLGVNVYDLPNLREVVDNQCLQQHLRQRKNPSRLELVLGDFEIPSSYLHNAGNDAVYTLQTLIALAVRKRQESLSKIEGKEQDSHFDISAMSDDEGWSTGGEHSDGGTPLKPFDSEATVAATEAEINAPTPAIRKAPKRTKKTLQKRETPDILGGW